MLPKPAKPEALTLAFRSVYLSMEPILLDDVVSLFGCGERARLRI